MQEHFTFDLTSSFVLRLWKWSEKDGEAAKTKSEDPRRPDGEYLANVLLSLELSLKAQNANVVALAKVLHERLLSDLDLLEKAIGEQHRACVAQLESDIVQMPKSPIKSTQIQLEANYMRPTIVKFARVFVLVDQSISAIYEQHRHGMIGQDAFYEARREFARPLRSFIYNTSKLVKLFHKKRRELTKDDPKPKKDAAA